MRGSIAACAAALLATALPAYAGKGGTHVTTDVRHQTRTQDRQTTRVRTVHRPNPVIDTTIDREITRVHPRHHVTDVTRYVHHVQRVDSDQYQNQTEMAPARVEHESAQEQFGALAHGTTHVVTHYHDVYKDDYSRQVHEVTSTPVIDHEIHRHIIRTTVQPVIHEKDVTHVIYDNIHRHRTQVEHEQVVGTAQTIVTHKREDVDP